MWLRTGLFCLWSELTQAGIVRLTVNGLSARSRALIAIDKYRRAATDAASQSDTFRAVATAED